MRAWMLFLATATVVVLSVGVSVAGATPSSGFSAQVLADYSFLGKRMLVQRITIQPGGTSGWHKHGGPTYVLIVSGTGSFYSPDCTAESHPPGSFFVERGPTDVAHVLRNETSQPLVVVAFFRLSGGAPPRIDQPAPAGCAVT